ncbi:hypothetical protein BRC81_02585 [Halobacteriales archaeon QS_1_68_20]|nr:MAG: hypothetical protein BRC81_02585 [Halobacteriales archaeon QS_1_68_20]
MTHGERAVSVPINYTLSIVIVTVLLTGLILATSDQLRAQQERTVESEFYVLGNRMAADVSAADRLAQTTEGTTDDVVRVRTEIPDRVADMNYEVEISSSVLVPGEAYEVTIKFISGRMGITEEAHLKTGTPVESSTLSAGEYVIEYVDTDGDGEPDALEVKNV